MSFAYLPACQAWPEDESDGEQAADFGVCGLKVGPGCDGRFGAGDPMRLQRAFPVIAFEPKASGSGLSFGLFLAAFGPQGGRGFGFMCLERLEVSATERSFYRLVEKEDRIQVLRYCTRRVEVGFEVLRSWVLAAGRNSSTFRAQGIAHLKTGKPGKICVVGV